MSEAGGSVRGRNPVRLDQDREALRARLRGSPYEGVKFPPPREFSSQDAHQAMDTVLRLGRYLYLSGASTRRVEAALVAATAAWGMGGVSFDLSTHSIQCQYAPTTARALHRVQVLSGNPAQQLAGLIALERLAEGVVRGRVGVTEAARRLDVLAAGSAAWPWWVTVLGAALLASMLCLLAGGSVAAALLSPVLAVAVQGAGRILGRGGAPPFFVTACQTVMVTVGAALLPHWGVLSGAGTVSLAAANLILLLPIFQVISSTEDSVLGYSAIAAGRLSTMLVLLGAIVGGAALAAPLISQLDTDLRNTAFRALPFALTLVTSSVGAIGNAVFMGGPPRLIPWAVATALCGACANVLLLREAGMPTALAALCATALMGVLAAAIAPPLRLSARALVLPGLAGAVLPGPDAYRSLLHLGLGLSDAPRYAATVLVIVLCIGLGTTLGALLGDIGYRWTTALTRLHLR
ncbi:threonine/serine exporter family protein [Streptomyces sp. Ru73]|uniref:threonine/serine exporter family protein n=1 Tax=Streptomyces sp. Ru73 TaxID=2080748 RepID=UPI0015E28A89|nr:threonine/serine exporter family protein [Streptomyces sp. Ru73]